jgi:ubiquinone biosynthesis protein COQ9
MPSNYRVANRLLAAGLHKPFSGRSHAVVGRCYHSYDHSTPPSPLTDAERTILVAAYKHVPEHGFSQRALTLGAKDANYLDISTSLLPDGAFSLVRYHLYTQREALADIARELFGTEETVSQPKVSDRVEILTWERLMGNRHIIHRWQEV